MLFLNIVLLQLCIYIKLAVPQICLFAYCSLSCRSIEHNGLNGVDFVTSDNNAGRGSRQVKGVSLILKQFYALLVKRFRHATRSKKDFLAQVRKSRSTVK